MTQLTEEARRLIELATAAQDESNREPDELSWYVRGQFTAFGFAAESDAFIAAASPDVVRALADAYLAQQRVVAAARRLYALRDAYSTASTPKEALGLADEIEAAQDELRAAVSVGSPETRETEE